MTPPKIFISATSGDLSSAREIAAKALLTINCHPVEQTNFEPDWRSVTDMLRGKIGDCQALIHLVGFRYGAEPDPATLPPGTPRRSYTQMEYHLARELGLRVYTFLLPEIYPFDLPAKAETTEQTQLQAAHRALIQSSPHLYEKPASVLDLRTRIIALQEMVIRLEQEQQSIAKEVKTTRHWGLWVGAAILLILGGIGVWHWQTKKATSAIAASQTNLAAQLSQVQEALSRIQQSTDPQKDPISGWPLERLEKALAQQMNFKVEDLRALLTAGKTSLDALVAGQALLASGKADEAGQKFDTVIAQEQSALQRLQQAYAGKAQIAYDKARYEESLDYRQKAAALVDKAAKPIAWADAQGWSAFILCALARYNEAEPLMRESLILREQHSGPTHPDTARDLHNLASLLQSTNRHADAEPLYRRALNINERSFGPNHHNLAKCFIGLASLLQDRKPYDEAEQLYRRALKITESSFGPRHTEVAVCLNGLAVLLMNNNRLKEAELLMRRALKIQEDIFGPNHPNVGTCVNNLGLLLQANGSLKDAEVLMRRALKIDEDTFGPNHPNVAVCLVNLGGVLQSTQRQEEAEHLILRALEIYLLFQKQTEYEHPNYLSTVSTYVSVIADFNLTEEQIHTKLRSVLGPKFDLSLLKPFRVTITEVVKGGQGEALGLQVGDEYVSYNGQTISSTSQIVRLTGESKGESVPLEVLRGGKKHVFAAKPGKLGTRIENRPLPPTTEAEPAK